MNKEVADLYSKKRIKGVGEQGEQGGRKYKKTPVLINSMSSVSTVLIQGRIKTVMNTPQTTVTMEKRDEIMPFWLM